jgi:phosphohistidine phosphatase
MKTLILMRHAKSDWGSPGLADFDRPLNARGQRSARALGDWLRAKGHVPDEILCSSARRTAETCAGLNLDLRADFTRALYHAEPGAMAHELAGATGDRVLMIGHNPGVGEWAGQLVAAPPDHPRFFDYPTGATLVIDFDIADWAEARRGTVRDFVVARDLTD